MLEKLVFTSYSSSYVNQQLVTKHYFLMPQDSGIDYLKSLNSVLIFMHSREN